jgi:peptide deformylase
MPSQVIVKIGNKQLATPSAAVSLEQLNSPHFKELIQNMRDTMAEKGGVGIASPQIGCNQRVIMFGFEKSKRYPNEKPVPFTIIVNPNYTILSEEKVDGWEGCLSVPGLRGVISRFNKIEYFGYDLEGQQISRIAEGFHARVVQHECDHLDGVLFPHKLKDPKLFGFEDELGGSINI